jgi:predicted lipoprotein with Yx(FWY)xxD motif
VVPEKRKLMVVGAAIAAALALPGCAPAGYNAADYSGGSAVDPAANEAGAAPTAEPTGEPEPAPTETDPAGDAAGKLPEDEVTSELSGTSVKRMGKVVVDQEGFVLYRFDGDKVKPEVKSTCDGDCARVWPPALTNDGKPEIDGVDPDDVGTVTRADGTKQLTIGNWPVYRYLGDKKAGQWRGQNVGGKWFVINPDGTKNLTCLPPVSKPVAPPADEEGAEEDDSGNGAADYSY